MKSLVTSKKGRTQKGITGNADYIRGIYGYTIDGVYRCLSVFTL